MKPLTPEQTAGTLTFFFPQLRDATTPPEATLIVRRVAENAWQAGLALCSNDDMFSRRLGRKIAFHRLEGRPIFADNVPGLLTQVMRRVLAVTGRRPLSCTGVRRAEIANITLRLQDMRIE